MTRRVDMTWRFFEKKLLMENNNFSFTFLVFNFFERDDICKSDISFLVKNIGHFPRIQ